MQNQHNTQQLFDAFQAHGVFISPEYRRAIEARVDQILGYRPTVGVFGKTGAGKSSLCNALFGQDVCPVSDIAACTRQTQELTLGVGGKGITLLDVPGVGESCERDREYDTLYRDLMPRLDLILWVLKADDRAYTSDEIFFKNIVRPHVEAGTPFFLVINQVDKIEPFRECDESARQPGPRQAAAIEQKRHAVAAYFGIPLEQVRAVSADERYGLVGLVDGIIHALPREKRVAVLREVRGEHRSAEAREKTRSGFVDAVVDFVVDVVPFIPKAAKRAVTQGVKKLINWVASWF